MLRAEIKEKRSVRDWSTEEVNEMIARCSDQDCSDSDEDSGDLAKSDEVSH